jgi:ABC-type bacteriocin/lantibiotic exporter with double-glycine peptidase domain
LSIFLLLAACAAPAPSVPKPEAAADLPRRYVLDTVPQYYQSGPNCGPVTMHMVLAYYGVQLSREKVEEDIRTSTKGTSLISLVEYPKSLGFKTEDKENGTINEVVGNIAKGRPVVVRQWMKPESKLRQSEGHFRVVIGYDLDQQTIYMRDPNKSGLSKASFQEFNNLWDFTATRVGGANNWMLVIYK